eukprot:1506549-Amphidinium_carterae.1
MQEEIVLTPIRETLACGVPRGSVKVCTTGDEKFQVGDIVVFQDVNANTEAHRVKGHGSLVLDAPLTRDFPAGSEVRTMMGLERLYTIAMARHAMSDTTVAEASLRH